ncbi:hypothetical protein [Brevundimonas diminuta]|uniref:hypothetical protein n=1 Tax=Brevundimonas diminuta TaxID=293 RepID=UPI00320ACC70
MFKRSVVAAVFTLLAAPSLVQAQQTEAYFYDVHGRVQAVTRAPANGGYRSRYGLDDADNRSSRNIETAVAHVTPNELRSNESILPSQSLWSLDGRFRLVVQHTDGNLVLYGPSGALWATSTTTGQTTILTMQSDGNLAIRGPANELVWSSGTGGYPGALLRVQNDGNLVIYSGATPVWATNTCCH